MNDKGIEMRNGGMASDHRRAPGAARPCDEPAVGESRLPESANPEAWLDRVRARDNWQRALKQVRQNQGAPGIDGMTVEELPGYFKHPWLEIRAQLESGTCHPRPVKRVVIPKSDGKTRPLGIPTVVDRFIQQAIAQVVSAPWEPPFHPRSYGLFAPSRRLTLRASLRLFKIAPGDFVRPHCSAQQAVRELQRQVRDGYRCGAAELLIIEMPDT